MKITINKEMSGYAVEIDLEAFTETGKAQILCVGTFNNWSTALDERYLFHRNPGGGFLPLRLRLPLTPTYHEFKLFNYDLPAAFFQPWYRIEKGPHSPYYGLEDTRVPNGFNNDFNLPLHLTKICV